VGETIGTYADSTGALHAFLRYANGKFVKYDAPGATCSGNGKICTDPIQINSQGDVVGVYSDGSFSFIRFRNGKFAVIDVPGSKTTAVNAINDLGESAGTFLDANGRTHGFIRHATGAITRFEIPDFTATQSGFVVSGINDSETIAGTGYDNGGIGHSFVRTRLGKITVFDPPGASSSQTAGINARGEVAGSDPNGGYLRFPSGRLITFLSSGYVVLGLNFSAAVTGTVARATLPPHGFVRTRDGRVTIFAPPRALQTLSASINDSGRIAGWYIDKAVLEHGFIRY
jgi:hypothetical protein